MSRLWFTPTDGSESGCIDLRGDVEVLEIHDGKLWAITTEGVAEVPIPPLGMPA